MSELLSLEHMIDVYAKDTHGKVQTISMEAAEQAKAELSAIHWQSDVHHRNYSQGWAIQKSSKAGYIGYEVWNKTNYRLVHLLEFGHGFHHSDSTADEFPHVQPAEEKYGAMFVADIQSQVTG